MANAATDAFHKEDVQQLALALNGHDHTTGKGLGVNVSSIADNSLSGAKLTDGTVTSAKILDGTIQSADIAAAGIANDRLGPDVARANLLTNGGFEIWQRGNGPVTTATFSADRWSMFLAGTDTYSVSKNTANADGPGACAALTFTLGTGAGGSNFYQPIPTTDNPQLPNRTVSFSIRVRTSTANAARPVIYENVGGNHYGSYHTGGGAYETLTFSLAVPSGATTVNCGVAFSASCTAYLDNACLVVGSQAANYVPLHPADDLARCLRYYEIIGNENPSAFMSGSASGAGQPCYTTFPYKAIKPVAPTVTKNGTWIVGNGGQPALFGGGSTKDAVLSQSSSAAGQVTAYCNAAGLNLTVEANP